MDSSEFKASPQLSGLPACVSSRKFQTRSSITSPPRLQISRRQFLHLFERRARTSTIRMFAAGFIGQPASQLASDRVRDGGARLASRASRQLVTQGEQVTVATIVSPDDAQQSE